ncbi:MAG TPA: class I SAM-dependent methyltransferase [Phycisphaerae bacterium]|nr:class I SAM-dependent methyltransferase [Phycisphaerae bacterium]
MGHTQPAVQLDPVATLDPDRFMDYERSVLRSRLVDSILSVIDRPNMRVCDVGGATGVLLQKLREHSAYPIDATVFEVNDAYADRLAHPSIRFEQGSIVDNNLPPCSFDVVTCRHIIHHLVADTVRDTLALQRKAIAELIRITKPGGYLILEEQVNLVKPFSRAVYYLSKLANRAKFNWKYFEAGNVVISFLTPAEISAMVGTHVANGNVWIEKEELSRRKVELRWKLTLLMGRGGDMLYVIGKNV